MKDTDVDTQLTQHLSGGPPREAFRQQALHDSTAALIYVRRRRSALRRAELAAAAVLIAGVAFLGGRLSAPPSLPRSVDIAPQAAAVPNTPRGEPNGVTVPNDLVAWLQAARLFRQLGMEERMALAVDRAAGLLPVDTVAVDGQRQHVFVADGSFDNQKKAMEPMGMPGQQRSAESTNQILAQLFGD
jgi:hypothetical protein